SASELLPAAPDRRPCTAACSLRCATASAIPRAHTAAMSADESRTARPPPKSYTPLCSCFSSCFTCLRSRGLHLAPNVRSHIFALHLRQLAQQLARAFIMHIRRPQHHFHNLVTASILA